MGVWERRVDSHFPGRAAAYRILPWPKESSNPLKAQNGCSKGEENLHSRFPSRLEKKVIFSSVLAVAL